jgi:hypothetical protein
LVYGRKREVTSCFGKSESMPFARRDGFAVTDQGSGAALQIEDAAGKVKEVATDAAREVKAAV